MLSRYCNVDSTYHMCVTRRWWVRAPVSPRLSCNRLRTGDKRTRPLYRPLRPYRTAPTTRPTTMAHPATSTSGWSRSSAAHAHRCCPKSAMSSPRDLAGPVRGGGVSGRSAAPTKAESASLDVHKARPGRQHARSVIGARPLAAFAVVAPPNHRVCRRHRRTGCSARKWTGSSRRRPRASRADVSLPVPWTGSSP